MSAMTVWQSRVNTALVSIYGFHIYSVGKVHYSHAVAGFKSSIFSIMGRPFDLTARPLKILAAALPRTFLNHFFRIYCNILKTSSMNLVISTIKNISASMRCATPTTSPRNFAVSTQAGSSADAPSGLVRSTWRASSTTFPTLASLAKSWLWVPHWFISRYIFIWQVSHVHLATCMTDFVFTVMKILECFILMLCIFVTFCMSIEQLAWQIWF